MRTKLINKLLTKVICNQEETVEKVEEETTVEMKGQEQIKKVTFFSLIILLILTTLGGLVFVVISNKEQLQWIVGVATFVKCLLLLLNIWARHCDIQEKKVEVGLAVEFFHILVRGGIIVVTSLYVNVDDGCDGINKGRLFSTREQLDCYNLCLFYGTVFLEFLILMTLCIGLLPWCKQSCNNYRGEERSGENSLEQNKPQ